MTTPFHQVSYDYEPSRNLGNEVHNAAAVRKAEVLRPNDEGLVPGYTAEIAYNSRSEVTGVQYQQGAAAGTAFESESYAYDTICNRLSTEFNAETAEAQSVSYRANALNQYADIEANAPLDGNSRPFIPIRGSNPPVDEKSVIPASRRSPVDEQVASASSRSPVDESTLDDPTKNKEPRTKNTGKSAKHYFPLYDANGNIVQFLDETATIAAHSEYDAFGKTRVVGGADREFADSNPWLFSTKQQEETTGFHYYGFRYYSPQVGRFINRDPIEEEGGANLYAFVMNGPMNGLDYLGLDYTLTPRMIAAAEGYVKLGYSAAEIAKEM